MIRKLFGSSRASGLVAGIAFAAINVLASLSAQAAAPMAHNPAPAFYRIMVGEFEITALSDGTVDLPMNKLLNQNQKKTDQALAHAFEQSPLETSVNTYLVNTGSKLILIDTGAGNLFGPTLGKLIANLKASGYQPEQVDEIYLTHMHPDHVGGLMTNGAIAFPNALLRADRHESEFWLSQSNMDQAAPDNKGFFQGAIASVNPYVKTGKYSPFDGNTELAPGVISILSQGHTVGHTSYLIQSKGQKLLLIGDLIHVAAVQFDTPSVTIAFDSDQKQAAAERLQVFSSIAKDGILVGAAHLPFPGLGHVGANGKGFRWIPVNYTQIR
ncbi:Glyoxylase, beta-lactamase superfamily II [Collimonas sp. OK307]|uniref:MBL fold metallo-hydrolase n=1 Tax=Collimonas sp. OK307 TaxID=1801620 RepID=UPI0008E67477|nr:MBL fold metallo-hydrolase [Collimonas sp. OK307]SFH61748.1 Glyoxylase, beta-lactamase superfamily II [Collimonas sp. OK307]